jgi:membrane protein YdbS with pleckstrin-like domain
MSESVKPLGIGVHELLRYAIPGYSFFLVLFLPFIFTGTLLLVIPDWQSFVALLLIVGILVGYVLYYPYYWMFRTRVYNFENRDSLRVTCQKMFNTKCWEQLSEKNRFEVLAIHSIAMAKEEGRIGDACLFQFSVFHSIGTMSFSIWLGWISSLFLALRIGIIPKLGWEFWGVIGGIALLLTILSCFLISEYRYRRRLAFEIENQIVMTNLESVIKKWKDETKEKL